jgi:hypothetical protein
MSKSRHLFHYGRRPPVRLHILIRNLKTGQAQIVICIVGLAAWSLGCPPGHVMPTAIKGHIAAIT